MSKDLMTDVVSLEYYHADASTVGAADKTSAGTLFLLCSQSNKCY